MASASGLLLFHSALCFHVDLLSLLSEAFNATLWRLNPAWWWCHPRNIIPSYQAFRLPPSSVWYLVPLLPLSSLLFLPCHLWLPPISSSTSVSSNHLTPFQIHPHQLADSVHFTRRAQCSDPRESMADKSMLSLFSMPLLPSIFFSVTLLFVERLELCSIKLSSLSGTNCNSVRLSAQRQTLMLALDGSYKSFIYEIPHSNRSCSGFYWSWTWIYWYCELSFRWGMLKACLDSEVFHFEPELMPKTETKQISFDHIC